ncbi:hypothetical protein C8R41DRAFT_914309 [Lentinula lateritia]|uniref:Uncharacterized protein n=1 Tax=Lentinula lateritia TaxID=40482 RepID=A0ABQ8VYF0_9AGAR|nr:hypothetical protein C8R41DRAFT_914309 [Lentinula lateritia]
MASTSSQTQSSASTTLLPTSLLEAQVLLSDLKLKSTLPLFFESSIFQRLQQGDYVPPVLDSQNSPDYHESSSFPAFSYPCPLVPFCFPPDTLRPLSVASGLDLFCSTQMAVRALQDLVEESPSTESEIYNVFEEAAPFLIYIHDFWMGRANCPLFAEQVLSSAESLTFGLPAFLRDNLTQQWGIPPEHRSSAKGVPKFEQFPAIPIPFCLRFREGSAMMRSVPSKDLDVFASLRGKGSTAVASPIITASPPLEIKSSASVSKTPVAPPRLIRRNRELESLKTDASMFFASPRSTHSKDSDNELLRGSPSADTAPRASMSTKVPVDSKKPKSKTTIKVVEDSKASISSPAESEDEDEEEDSAPPPKCLKTTSSISASVPRRSVKRVSAPKRVSKAATKSTSERSPDSTFQPVLLADAQGRLRLPEQSTGAFTPFPKFAHARNSAALTRENPLLAINPDFVELGSILETQNARFTMKDLMQVNRVIRDPSIPSQACVSALARGDLEANSAPLPGYKCQACSSRSLKCLGSLDVELAMDALNALHKASTSSTHNCRGGPHRRTRGPQGSEPNRRAINLNEWTLLATLFRWPSPFNLSGLDFDNRTPGEWIELLRSIHSGGSTAHIDDKDTWSSLPRLRILYRGFGRPQGSREGVCGRGCRSHVEGIGSYGARSPYYRELAERALSPEKGQASADS